MKYSIFYLMKGNAKDYRDKLVKEVGPRFGENYILDSKLPAHITLKAPFNLDNIQELENILANFVKERKKEEIEIIGFDNFKRFVVFLKFNFPKPALKIQSDLINELKKIKNMDIEEHDKKWHPHATITYINTENNFNNIRDYLQKLDKLYFKIYFDNITLMKKIGKYWRVYKEFKIK